MSPTEFVLNLIRFRHADRDLEFTISPIPWDEQYDLDPASTVVGLPATDSTDAGKFLAVDGTGKPVFIGVSPGAVDFNTRQFNVTGKLGSPAANLNGMKTPMVVHPSQLVFIHDQESGKGYVWVGGVGTFGYQGGGDTVDSNMLMEIESGDVKINFATADEVAAGKIED